jgi:hypothetical protein
MHIDAGVAGARLAIDAGRPQIRSNLEPPAIIGGIGAHEPADGIFLRVTFDRAVGFTQFDGSKMTWNDPDNGFDCGLAVGD